MSGDVFAIGGHEDKTGDRELLGKFVESMPRPGVIVLTAGTKQPKASFATYQEAFAGLGAQWVKQLDVRSRAESEDPGTRMVIDGAGGFFFTGGDQERIVDAMGDTGLSRAIHRAWQGGAVIGGTSAGASVMSTTMLVRGRSAESTDTDAITLAPGLGYLDRIIVDQHFAERGRVGRLLAAVALRPELIGVGIDENTAICVRGERLIALGEGALTVLDAKGGECNSPDPGSGDPLSIFDVRLHQLSAGDYLDMASRRPSREN